MVDVIRAAVLLCVALALAAPAARGEEVYVAAAHSMRELVDEMANGYERAHPGIRIVRNYGGSGALAMQIEGGAPADVFISASGEWVERLLGKKLVEAGNVHVLASNALVFVGRKGAAVSGMKDLPSLARIAIGSPRSVPAGEYASQAIAKSGLARKLAKKLVMARDVREALLYAERGEVDGAFVYRSDARRSKAVVVLFEVPPELHDRIIYPVALTASGARKPAARAFFDTLRSAASRPLLQRLGFAVP
ncbi:MAG TPA: molybdate ABC transporter substrate-binding protein [Candidatus Deferrimicrobiaceae bacterium]